MVGTVKRHRLKETVKALLGKEGLAGRNVTVFPDDTFITSYPKSGNTWTRFLVANLIWCDGSTDFLNIQARVPDIYKSTDSDLREVAQPRYLKSHEYFDPRYPKVLYIVRDPRSILVSYYQYELRWATRFGTETSYYDFTQAFLSGSLDAFGSWKENVLSWLRVRGDNPQTFCLVRYEDLQSNGEATLGKIAAFLNLERSSEQLKQALEMSSFSRMKQLEQEAKGKWEPGPKNQNIPFVRSGSVNEWRQVLDAQTLDLIWEQLGVLLTELGYEA